MSICVHAHASPSTLTPLTRLTLHYLWVHAGIIAIPARVYYPGMLMRGIIWSAAPAEIARRPDAKALRGVRSNAASRRAGQWDTVCNMRAKGDEIRESAHAAMLGAIARKRGRGHMERVLASTAAAAERRSRP